jgi:hypothetical protein
MGRSLHRGGRRKEKGKRAKGKGKNAKCKIKNAKKKNARSFVPPGGTQDDREAAQGKCPGTTSKPWSG